MNKFSTLKIDLLDQWIDTELQLVNSEIRTRTEKLPSNESIEFLKQFAAGYFPVESKDLEFECMLN